MPANTSEEWNLNAAVGMARALMWLLYGEDLFKIVQKKQQKLT